MASREKARKIDRYTYYTLHTAHTYQQDAELVEVRRPGILQHVGVDAVCVVQQRLGNHTLPLLCCYWKFYATQTNQHTNK
jgi:hypothetical protein